MPANACEVIVANTEGGIAPNVEGVKPPNWAALKYESAPSVKFCAHHTPNPVRGELYYYDEI